MAEIEKIANDYFWRGHKLDCKFFENNHTYWLGFYENDEFVKVKELVSVTTLMKKHELVKGYGNAPKSVLQKKAKRGTLIHKELEDWAKNGEIGFSDELHDFILFSKANDVEIVKSEYIVFNDVVAGTIDVKFKMHGFDCKADYKTTSKYDEEYLSWQLSIYNYLDNEKDEKLICFHFHDNKLDVLNVPQKSDLEIENLFEKERKNHEDN